VPTRTCLSKPLSFWVPRGALEGSFEQKSPLLHCERLQAGAVVRGREPDREGELEGLTLRKAGLTEPRLGYRLMLPVLDAAKPLSCSRALQQAG
jgi:hypothetical protein